MQKAQRDQEKIKATPEGSRLSGASLCCTNFTRPTGALDSKNGQEIVRLLKESNQKYGQTLLLVTHDENIALQAERIVTIADGKVVRDSKEKRKTARMEGQSAVKRERKVERP